MDIGNLLEELVIKCNKKIYLLFLDKYINVLDANGNLNVKVKNVINSGIPTSNSNDGLYYDGTNIYLKFGSDIVDMTKSTLPKGSIIMYEGDEAPDGWYKYADSENFNGVIYIINKSGSTPTLANVVLKWNPSTNPIRVTLGDSFVSPVLEKIVSGNIPLIINYSSSDTSKAIIDENGNVTLKAAGQTTIKAETAANLLHKAASTLYTLIISEPEESGVKSFTTLIDEFNNKGIYSPSILSFGNTSDIYNYLEDMYNKSRQEYEGNSELFLPITYESLEVYNYHGNNKEYELDGTAENAMLYWIIATCLSELVPTSGNNNKQTRLFKFAYDLGGNDGDGRKYRLYNNYTPKGDLTICRLVASVIYAKNRPTYKSSIPTFRNKLGGSTISISGTLKDGLNLEGSTGSKPTSYGYSVDIDSIFPAAAGPYSPSYTNRLNSPLTQQGENHDNFNSTTLNYVIDENINETVVNNYNLRTSNSNIFKRAILAISDDYEEVEHYLDDKIYYTYPNDPGNDVTYPHDRFTAATSSLNKGYFTGTFNNSVVTSKNLSLYKNSSNFTDFLALMRDACAWNRQTTFWPQYGRKRPSQGSSDCGCITGIGLHSDQNWLDDWGILNLAGGATKYDSNGEKYYVDRNFSGNQTDNREDNESSYYAHNCDYLCSTTYPSGHSAGVWGTALSLIELLSDMGITNSTEINNIYKAAYAFTVSRTIVRAHWNSDTIYGKLNTTTIFPVLHAMSTFNSIFDNAKTALNSEPTSTHSIDIAYVESFDGSSPAKTGVKGMTFKQPTLYVKENNIVYTLDDYPYASQLKPLLTYKFYDNSYSSYAIMNSDGSVELTNLTPTSLNSDRGIRIDVEVANNNIFTNSFIPGTTISAHFYIKIIELAGDTQIYAIIDNQTGANAYITGEILYYVTNSSGLQGTIVTCSDENIANDNDGGGDGEPNNVTLIELNPGENLLHFAYVEYSVGFDKTKTPIMFTSKNVTTSHGKTVSLTARVYAHGITKHEGCAFKSTILNNLLEFVENNIIYKIKIEVDENYDYDLMYVPNGVRPGEDSTVSKFAVVSDIHINNETKRDYFKTFVDYCASNSISYIACAGDLLEDAGADFNYLNPAIEYATSKGITFLSCYGNHDSQVIYDLYHRTDANMTSLQVTSNLNSLNTKPDIVINTVPNIGMFIYLSLNYNYPGTSTFWSDGASCGSTKLSSLDILSLLNICGTGSGYTSADESYNYLYYSTSDLISLALTLESNQSLVIYLFTHHPFRHKAALDSYSTINPYKAYSTTNANNKFSSMGGWGSNTLTGILFYFLNWLNNKYKNVIWFTGHNHQPWGGNNYSKNDSYIIKPSGSSTSNYSKGLSDGISSALNINLPSLKSTQEAGIVEVSNSGIKVNQIKISGSTTSKTGEYSYTFDRNYPYSNPPNISYDDVPSGNSITLKITNGTDKIARLNGKFVFNITNGSKTDGQEQAYSPEYDGGYNNPIEINPGQTRSINISNFEPEPSVDNSNPDSSAFFNGTWSIRDIDYPIYLYSAMIYGLAASASNNDGDVHSKQGMYFAYGAPTNKLIKSGQVYEITINSTYYAWDKVPGSSSQYIANKEIYPDKVKSSTHYYVLGPGALLRNNNGEDYAMEKGNTTLNRERSGIGTSS